MLVFCKPSFHTILFISFHQYRQCVPCPRYQSLCYLAPGYYFLMQVSSGTQNFLLLFADLFPLSSVSTRAKFWPIQRKVSFAYELHFPFHSHFSFPLCCSPDWQILCLTFTLLVDSSLPLHLRVDAYGVSS